MNSVDVLSSSELRHPFLMKNVWDDVARNPYEILAHVSSVCFVVALECQRILLHVMLRLQITASLSTKSVSNTVTDAEMAVETDKQKLDMTDVTTAKISERSGTVKKKGKSKKSKVKKRNEGEKKDKKRRNEEDDRQKSGSDGEQSNSKMPDGLDTKNTQRTPKAINLKPRTRSNIWIKVTEDKTTQDVQLAFMRTQVPKSLPLTPPKEVASQSKLKEEKTTKAKKKKPKRKTKKK